MTGGRSGQDVLVKVLSRLVDVSVPDAPFDRYAAEFTVAVLLGGPAPGPGPLAEVFRGEPYVTA